MSRAGIAAAFGAGAVFGVGRWVAGMTDPANVQGFLDVTGQWRPHLLAVLGTAMLSTMLMFRLARRRARPWLGARFAWPASTHIDARLLAGSAMFGAGWALAGYCPGPALTALGAPSVEAGIFVAAMAAGLWLAGAGSRIGR